MLALTWTPMKRSHGSNPWAEVPLAEWLLPLELHDEQQLNAPGSVAESGPVESLHLPAAVLLQHLQPAPAGKQGVLVNRAIGYGIYNRKIAITVLLYLHGESAFWEQLSYNSKLLCSQSCHLCLLSSFFSLHTAFASASNFASTQMLHPDCCGASKQFLLQWHHCS